MVVWTSEEWKKPSFISSELGSGGLPKNENLKIKIRKFGVLEFLKNKSLKDLFVNRKPRFGLESLEKVKLKFISLVSRMDSKEQKKTKDSFGEFSKDQDS
ncbi:unnamed protein product [Rhizophagus irregularis]|nr:unnamed protein product [Rhizophagus irregularis]